MDEHSFTEVSSQGWFSRIGDSIKGILFGLFLFIAAFPLLWWNEGRSVERFNSLKEGLGQVIAIEKETINSANRDKLVHTQGLAQTQEVLSDTVFGVSAQAIKLQRQVSMYQWQEHSKTETKEEVGGSKTTKTTYSYKKGWHTREINSSNFKRSGYQNPSMPYQNNTQQAQAVSLGAFKLNASQIANINAKTALNLYDMKPPTHLNGKALQVNGHYFYIGDNPNNPQLGDLKVSFSVVQAQEISVVAQQTNNSFIAYQTKAGGMIDLLTLGLVDANSMFASAQAENTLLTWGIRFAGLLLMFFGLSLVFKPLVILGSVLPFLGYLISMGTGLLSFLIALPCAMITIAIAWIAYRPILAGSLIALAVVSMIVIKLLARKQPEVAYS